MSRKNLPTNTSSYQPVSYLDDGAPYSSQFDDIYFDTAQGTQQSEVVFIEGNNLINQWNDWKKSTFTIAETGFGTGLNFILTLAAFEHWLKNKPANSQTLKLHFISVEKYPLSLEELKKSLSVITGYDQYVSLLLSSYPETFDGSHFKGSFLSGHVDLSIYIGDATNTLDTVALKQRSFVNSWFLDGFSPSKNPDMWHQGLYNTMADLSADEATLATFTVAGHVRRGLKSAGFRLEKKATSLNKNHILVGKFQTSKYKNKGYMVRPTIDKPQFVSIIGGGIASACAAWSLAQRGIRVQLLCKDDTLAQEASSNPIGAIYPLIHQTADILSCFFNQAFFHARTYYDNLIKLGYDFDHDWCGLVEVAHNDTVLKRQEKFAQLNSWPTELVEFLSPENINAIANIPVNKPGLFFKNAGWASPAMLVNQLVNAAVDTGYCKVRLNTQITQIDQLHDNKWRLTTNKGQLDTPVLIVCGGADSNIIKGFPTADIYPVQGQVTVMRSTGQTSNLSTVLCHKGYVTPQNGGEHCIGATFKKQVTSKTATSHDDLYNLEQLHKGLPDSFDWSSEDIVRSNARLRACTIDHLPIVGAMPDISAHEALYYKLSKDKNWKFNVEQPVVKNLYVMTGLGARGLCSAPLLADILAAELADDIYPIDQDMLFNLAPNRFIVKDLTRRGATRG